MKKLFLLIIVVVGFSFRFVNLNWDSNHHLHPDERFLTMVGNAMRLPSSFGHYLDPKTSTFNPANIGFQFYVYGTFPLILNKLLALQLEMDDYNSFTLLGRTVSAFFDLLAVVIVYKIANLLTAGEEKRRHIPFVGAFFYAIAVLPIQLAHFFAVDTFLNFFVLLSFYFSLKYYFSGDIRWTAVSAISLGLALACKITAIFILPLVIFCIVIRSMSDYDSKSVFWWAAILTMFRKKWRQIIAANTVHLIGYTVIVYLVLRIADPYKFETASFFQPQISKLYVKNITELKSFENKEAWFPPAVQWINKPPITFSLYNLAVYGVGTPYFLLFIIGYGLILKTKTGCHKRIIYFASVFWWAAFFVYQSSVFAKTFRYFIFLYPLMAIYTAFGWDYFYQRARGIAYAMLVVVLIWPLAFSAIYLEPHSRVQASEWIYQHVPNGSVILVEHWDDALPLPLSDNFGRQYKVVELPVFGQDNEEKWETMSRLLKEGDYYILSSNRGWGSITTVPERYTRMSRFYDDLFAGKLNYRLIKKVVVTPRISFLGLTISLPDERAEESFTVYDHPAVQIFKNYAK